MKIKSIKKLDDPQFTVDVEVANTHSYHLANGVISHNSLSKIMDCTEGVHKPLGKYIFNNIQLSKHDDLVDILKRAHYEIIDHPVDENSCLVKIPVEWQDVEFDVVERDGESLYVNLESAVDQLDRYKFIMDNYVDIHNCSNTISYSPEEVPDIIEWIYTNWDSFVGVSFLYRNDPTKTAEDLGYPYLPQEVVTKSVFEKYLSIIEPIELDMISSEGDLVDVECAGGACPVR